VSTNDDNTVQLVTDLATATEWELPTGARTSPGCSASYRWRSRLQSGHKPTTTTSSTRSSQLSRLGP